MKRADLRTKTGEKARASTVNEVRKEGRKVEVELAERG